MAVSNEQVASARERLNQIKKGETEIIVNVKEEGKKLTDKESYKAYVMERIKEFTTMGAIEVGGKLKLPDDYSDINNVELQKFIYFFRAVNYNEEICELLVNPVANSVRAAILETPLANLMIQSVK